ncbi:MAG TPA: LPS export ABC transporter periplasmic protein LptC [Exilispira sp.]|nr:LPS export ABC transporter periplasmic protein LptC [Exilispira sp.]
MVKKIKLSFFSIMMILFFIFLLGIVFSTLVSNKNNSGINSSFPFNLEEEKYKSAYPDIIMLNGKINSNSSDKNQRIEIFYDRIIQYSTLNYMKIENPKITIFENKEKLYYITSEIAYTDKIDDIKIVNLSGNASIKNLKQNIDIKGDLLVCNIEKKEISSEKTAFVNKDGFDITSFGIFINETNAIFKKDVIIKNKTGLYNSKIVDEFVDFEGFADRAIFNINDNSIKLDKNAKVSSKMLDIKGDQILFYQKQNNQNQKNEDSQRIFILNGYFKYINSDNDILYSKGDSIDYKKDNEETYFLKNGDGYFKDNKE